MEKSPHGAHAPSRQLAQLLQAQIASGEIAPGEKLPSGRELAKKRGVNKHTAMAALQILANQGLVVAEHGRGFFVRTFRPLIRNSIERVAARQWRAGKAIWERDTDGRNLTVDSLTVTSQVQPPAEIKALLGPTFEGTVTTRTRRYSVESYPVMFATSYIPHQFAQGTAITEENTGPGGIYARLAEAGHAPVSFREDVRSRMPASGETVSLNLPDGTPVFEVTRIAADSDGVPVEVNRIIMNSAAFVLRYDFAA